jgi:hypothetical protein
MSLSIKNRWFDEEDRAYIFFSVEEIMEMLNCGRNKAVNCLKELDQEKGIGLIEKRRIGLGKTNVIYVKNFSLTEYPDEPAIFDSEETPENVAERKENTETEIEEYAKKEPEKPVNTQKFEKQTVIILNIIILNLVRMNLINIYLNKRKGEIGYRREMSIDS